MKRATEYMFDIEGGPLKEGELRSCPFCNSTNISEETIRGNYYVQCLCCAARSGGEDTREKARTKWNVRMGR